MKISVKYGDQPKRGDYILCNAFVNGSTYVLPAQIYNGIAYTSSVAMRYNSYTMQNEKSWVRCQDTLSEHPGIIKIDESMLTQKDLEEIALNITAKNINDVPQDVAGNKRQYIW